MEILGLVLLVAFMSIAWRFPIITIVGVLILTAVALSGCSVTGGVNYDPCNDPNFIRKDCHNELYSIVDGGVNVDGNFVELN